MATFGLSYTLQNSTGHTASKWYWRAAGTSLWTTIITSGMTYSVPLQANNTIFDFQIKNINNSDNPTCAIFQGIGFTDPTPTFSIANDSISFAFDKPTDYITGYRVTIALFSVPETVLQTIEIDSPADTVEGTFSGLTNSTAYVIALLVAANEFTYTFTYDENTTDGSNCYPPANSSAVYLTSGTHITIRWNSPTSLPDGGFMGSYRRKALSTPYNTFITSGTTSGNTYTLSVEAPSSYDGFIQSSCEALDTLSAPDPFGVNAYQPLHVTALTNSSGVLILTVSSAFSNPYSTMVTGQVETGASLNFYNVTYIAGRTTQSYTITSGLPASTPITNLTIDTITSLFDNGGEIEQLDLDLSPDYFRFYSWLTSGVTWNGNPAGLPSFTLDNFIPTEQDSNINITKGILNFSWIYDSVYMNGAAPYSFATLRVIDPADSSVIGTVTIPVTPIGLRSASIVLSKQVSTISPDTLLTMRLIWANGSTGANLSFYLPEF